MQSYNFAFCLCECATWSLTLREGPQIEGVSKRGAEENIWT